MRILQKAHSHAASFLYHLQTCFVSRLWSVCSAGPQSLCSRAADNIGLQAFSIVHGKGSRRRYSWPKSVIIGQSGGPTAVINSSLAGVYKAACSLGADKVYGMKYGIEGLLKEELIELTSCWTTA